MSPAILNHNLFAGDTDTELGIFLKLSFDDNVFLDAATKEEIYYAEVSPTFKINFEEARYRTEVTASGKFRKSSDQDVEKDRFDFGVDLTGAYDFPTSVLNGALGFHRKSVLDTEFEDSGQFRNNDTKNAGNALIGYQTELSERWRLNISDNFQLVDYSSNFFNNFWNNTINIGFERDWTEYTVITFDFGYNRYQPDSDLLTSTDSYSFAIGLLYSYSENTSITANTGGTYVNDKLRWNAKLQISHELENLKFTLDASRQVSPSGLGEVRQTESISSNVSYSYSEDITAGLGASWRNSNSITAVTLQQDTKSQEISPWVNWQVDEHWNIRLSYRLRRLKRTLDNGWGVSNSVFLEFRY